MTKTASIACLILAAATSAAARPLSAKEKAYTKELGRLIKLPAKRAQALTMRRGTALGVRVRFDGLTLVRLRFYSAAAARAYGTRASKRAGKSPRDVEVRRCEVVLAGGALLKAPGQARRVMSAAWSASPPPPSAAPVVAERVVRRAQGPAIRLRPLRARIEPPAAPTSQLAGSYLVAGAGRIVIDQVQPGPDRTRCRVRFEGFAYRTMTHEFSGSFDGQVLVLTLVAARRGKAPITASYVWTPTAKGAATFALLGERVAPLPPGTERFWHPLAE